MPALAQPEDAARFEVVRTEGCRVFAADGRSAIDFQSGWCVGNLGWSRPEIEEALRDFDGPTYVYPGHHYAAWEGLARTLVEIAPPGLRRCFRATGGSEAVEIALQAAMAARSDALLIEMASRRLPSRNSAAISAARSAVIGTECGPNAANATFLRACQFASATGNSDFAAF